MNNGIAPLLSPVVPTMRCGSRDEAKPSRMTARDGADAGVVADPARAHIAPEPLVVGPRSGPARTPARPALCWPGVTTRSPSTQSRAVCGRGSQRAAEEKAAHLHSLGRETGHWTSSAARDRLARQLSGEFCGPQDCAGPCCTRDALPAAPVRFGMAGAAPARRAVVTVRFGRNSATGLVSPQWTHRLSTPGGMLAWFWRR
jgi:hypothetical protein